MIRVFLFFNESIPFSLRNALEQIREFQFCTVSEAELILFYTTKWNRDTFSNIPSQLRSLPMIVLCSIPEQPFTRDSIFRGDVCAVLNAEVTSGQIGAAAAAAITGLQVHQRVNPHDEDAGTILTPREMEILRLLADGEGNKTIADILNISQHTVKFHISSIFEKLNVYNRTEAVRAGITRGLLSV